MTQKISLIVGLGNPGAEYVDTRHNAGFWFIESIARDHHCTLAVDKKFHGLVGRAQIDGQTVHLLNPTTFMNRSGLAVAALAHFYKIPPESILVAHDELDIHPGTIRLKSGGGHGGHNGLRDIIQSLGNQKNFQRLRIGIGHPGDSKRVTGYVLGKPSQSDRSLIDATLDEALRHLPAITAGEQQSVMNELHRFNANTR